MSEVIQDYIKFDNKGDFDYTTIIQIFVWTLIILIISSIGLALLKGGKLATKTFGEQILITFLIILKPITFILNKIKRFFYFFLPFDSKRFFKNDDTEETKYIGHAWSQYNRLSTIVVFTTIIMLSFSGYMTLNPDKFPSIYGKILTYVAIGITLFFIFKSILLYTTKKVVSKDDFQQSFNFQKSGKYKDFDWQRSWLINNTLNYLKIGSVAIVLLAILGLALFFITTNDDAVKFANIILTWLGILVVLLFAYSFLKDVPFLKYLLNNKFFSLLYHIIFLIPCFILEFIEAIYKELKHTPKLAWWILFIELVLIGVYIIGPLISKVLYLNVHSKDTKDGGIRFKQEIKILEQHNTSKKKEIEDIRYSDNLLNKPFKSGILPIGDFWHNVLNEMLWIGPDYYNDEITKLNQKKRKLERQQQEELKEQREQGAEEKINQSIIDKKNKLDKEIDDLKLKKSMQPKKQELENKIKDVLWEDAKIQGLLNKSFNSGNNKQQTHLEVYDSITKSGPFKFNRTLKEEHYNKHKNDLDFLKETNVERYVSYVQTKGKEINNLQHEVQKNDEKIKILKGKVSKKEGHPKTVILLNGPVSLQKTHIPPGKKYPRARFPKKLQTINGDNYETSINEIDGGYNYDFALSSWIYIHAQAPNFYIGSEQSKNIIQWSNNSFQILYNTNDNSLEIKTKANKKIIKIPNVLFQKWINLVINYDGGHFDIFLDGELVKTLPQTVYIMPSTLSLKISQKNGVRGGICNVVHFASHLTKSQIINNYEAYKDKDPPIL